LSHFPTREDIVKFIGDQPGKVGKRDIAKAFQIKGSDRIPLKKLLREMAAEGLLDGSRKGGIQRAGDLPNVCVIRVTGRDRDSGLTARAVHDGEVMEGPDAPQISIDETTSRNRNHRTVVVVPGDTALARLRRLKDGVYDARIIRKLGGSEGQIIGLLTQRPDGLWIVPADRRERYDFRVVETTDAKDGDLVVGEKLQSARMSARKAKVINTLGPADAPNAFSLLAIAEQGIATVFPDAVLAEAESVQQATTQSHEDLTHIDFVTIDPHDARDHDDAVHASPDEDPENAGGFVIWVAIADVAAYVTPHSEMDREARKRGNSVYMPDRVVPMLPERLSTDLCSLREKQTRPCLAVRMRIGADGRPLDHQFHRGLMRSVAKLSYQQAQAAFDGAIDPAFEALDARVLQPLWQAYQRMAQARDARGPLNINRPERRIELDDAGRIARIYSPPRLEAHRLIEEMMVAANVCAAQTLERHKRTLIYRVHDTPPAERVRALADFIRPMGIKLSLGQTVLPNLFNSLMQQADTGDHGPSISEAVLRTQSQAIYDTENLGHFGLNLGRYAHFTSPIRRYADLTVHRALIAALKLGEDGQTAEEAENLPDIAQAISLTERNAMLAERKASDRYLSAYMSKQIGDSFTGRISGVSRAGLFVKLDDSGADGLIPISRLGAERFYADDDNLTLSGGTTGLTFRIGQEVEVKLEEATPIQGGLLFSLESGGSTESSNPHRPRRGGHPGQRARRRAGQGPGTGPKKRSSGRRSR
jgi:ribonuclease R